MDGEKGDLGKFVVSRSSLERQRNFNREISATLAMDHFKKTQAKHAQLHWDGKLIQDAMGKKWEAESILLSGSPDWIEGKLLVVARMKMESPAALARSSSRPPRTASFSASGKSEEPSGLSVSTPLPQTQ